MIRSAGIEREGTIMAREWIRGFIMLVVVSGCWVGFGSTPAKGEGNILVDIGEGSEWHYFKGTKEPPPKWNHIDFERHPKEWRKGLTGFGYGDERVITELGDMRNNYLAVYAARDFFINSRDYEFLQEASAEVILGIFCDGPFRAWLNGTEVISSHNERVGSEEDLLYGLEIDITPFARELIQIGSNVVCVYCANDSLDSEGFLFIPALEVRGE
jgi:hypothetical protein